jgi:hypothetical protein
MTTRKKKAAEPLPPAPEEPLIRVAFTADDLFQLLQQLEHWDSPIVHRLRLRLSRHRQRFPK